MRKLFYKVVKTVAATAMCTVLSVMSFLPVSTEAATKKQDTPFKYSIIVEDNSSEVVGQKSTVNVETFYERIKLAGNSAAVKRINKALLKASKAYNPDDIYSNAEPMADESDAYPGIQLYDIWRSAITYRDDKFISIGVTREWFAGGVGNSFLDGYVFDINTGKKVNIVKASGKSLSYIKQRLIANIKADNEFEGFEYEAYINGLKASDFSFYINASGLCTVVIPPYTFYGGAYTEYIIE